MRVPPLLSLTLLFCVPSALCGQEQLVWNSDPPSAISSSDDPYPTIPSPPTNPSAQAAPVAPAAPAPVTQAAPAIPAAPIIPSTPIAPAPPKQLPLAQPVAITPPAIPVSQPIASVESRRLGQLEAETQALREELAEMKRLQEQAVRLPPVAATPVAMTPAPAPQAAPAEEYYTMDDIRGEIKKNAWKKGDFTIVPYGILWGNMVYSTQRTSPGSYTLFVQSASTQPENEFLADGRNSRLGCDILGPRVPWFDCAQSGGKLEVDFQNSLLSTENKGTLLLRHAYIEAKNEEFRLVFGQTWDIISPLNPGMLMYSIAWDAGNIGYRRAQLRGERFFSFSETSLVTAQLSANQTVFEDATTTIRGESPNWPIIEGRTAWTIGHRGKDDLPITVGVSGHIGEEQADILGVITNQSRRTWSGNIDFRMPINERLGFQAECFTGENLGAFLGGIGQGINPVTLNPIRSTGGWFSFWYNWTPCLHTNFGYSVDDPCDQDLSLATDKTYNQCYFGNISYDLTKTFLVGFEVSSWKTLYLGQLPGDSIRSEFVAKYAF